MQIKPNILQGRKPEMTYITGVKNTINPIYYQCNFFSHVKNVIVFLYNYQNVTCASRYDECNNKPEGEGA